VLTPSRESGFGLIEIVVAAFVTAIVLGMFVMLFRSAFVRASDNDARAISSARLTEALDRLGDDLRSARAAPRADIASLSTRDDLRTRMLADPVRYGDVVHAAGRTFAAWTDSEADPTGPRCATYSIEQVHDDRLVWALVRRSGPPGGACPAAASEPAEVLVPLGADTPSEHVFTYGVLAQTSASPPTCELRTSTPSGASLTPRELLDVVSVSVDLGATASRRLQERNSSGRGAIDVWSRLNDDYYYAIGCSL
jgi:hypothetical protein